MIELQNSHVLFVMFSSVSYRVFYPNLGTPSRIYTLDVKINSVPFQNKLVIYLLILFLDHSGIGNPIVFFFVE